MKKFLAIMLALALLLAVGCEKPAGNEKTTVRIGVLNGPTGMGAAKLMADNEAGTTANQYAFELFGSPTDLPGLLIKGELDMAAVPTNMAALVYQKSGKNVKLLALNTLGVLYLLEKGDTVHSIKDLEGKTVATAGQASTPEYAMKFLLEKNGTQADLRFYGSHAEVVTQGVAGKEDLLLLPEPQVSVLLAKDAGFRVALDINTAWDEAVAGSSVFSMGCLVVRKAFAEEHPEAVKAFLTEYAASVAYVNEHPQEGAALIAQYKIIENKTIVEAAIPNCHMVCVTGEEMKTKTAPYLEILYGFDPTAVGGQLPDEEFYY